MAVDRLYNPQPFLDLWLDWELIIQSRPNH